MNSWRECILPRLETMGYFKASYMPVYTTAYELSHPLKDARAVSVHAIQSVHDSISWRITAVIAAEYGCSVY